MENASKALIIAGAILISILLISLGILVYNNAKQTADGGNLNAEEAQTFNTKITQYCGSKKSATDMNSLMDAIAASNGAQNKLSSGERHVISVSIGTSSPSYITGNSVSLNSNTSLDGISYPNFSSGTTFTATYKTDADGYVSSVEIKEN